MSIIILHIIATFDYYLLITKLNDKIKLFQKFSPKQVSFSVFIFSSLCYSYMIFTKEIRVINLVEIDEKNDSINMRLIHQMKPTYFWDSDFKKIIEIAVFFIRDGLNLSVLITLNFLIYFKVIKVIQSKSIFIKNQKNIISKATGYIESSIHNQNGDIQNRSFSTDQCFKAEKKVTIMVFAGCLNLILGRVPILISFILKNIIIWNRFLIVFDSIAVTTVYVSYMLNFFIFYLTNNRFNNFLKKRLNYFKIPKL